MAKDVVVTVGSDTDCYNLITLKPWDVDKAMLYAKAGIDPNNVVAGFHAAFQYPLLRALSTNGRAVSFLHSALFNLLKLEHQYSDSVQWPKMMVDNNVSYIFQQTVQNYLNANGVSKLAKRALEDFKALISTALSCALSGKLPDNFDDNRYCRNCFLYGLLSYEKGAGKEEMVNMSPALLVMCLSRFSGINSLLVTDGGSFETLVMLREVAKVLIDCPQAIVDIHRLPSPYPATVANSNCLEELQCNESIGNVSLDLYKNTFKLEGKRLVPTVECDGNHCIVILNGPNAPFADIIVFYAVKNSDGKWVWKVRLVQAKHYKDGYTASDNKLKLECGKMGAGERGEIWQSHPASLILCDLLADSAFREPVFVVSRETNLSETTKQKLAKLEYGVGWEAIEPVFIPFLNATQSKRTVADKINITFNRDSAAGYSIAKVEETGGSSSEVSEPPGVSRGSGTASEHSYSPPPAAHAAPAPTGSLSTPPGGASPSNAATALAALAAAAAPPQAAAPPAVTPPPHIMPATVPPGPGLSAGISVPPPPPQAYHQHQHQQQQYYQPPQAQQPLSQQTQQTSNAFHSPSLPAVFAPAAAPPAYVRGAFPPTPVAAPAPVAKISTPGMIVPKQQASPPSPPPVASPPVAPVSIPAAKPPSVIAAAPPVVVTLTAVAAPVASAPTSSPGVTPVTAALATSNATANAAAPAPVKPRAYALRIQRPPALRFQRPPSGNCVVTEF